MKKLLSALLLVLLILTTCGVNVFASQEYNNKSGSITINIADDDIAISGIKYSVYKIADIDSDDFVFNVLDPFGSVVKVLNNSNTVADNVWKEYLDDFVKCVFVNDVEPDCVGETTDGSLTFDELPVGLYLVCGEKSKTVIDGITYYYEPQSSLVSIPGLNEEYIYNIDINNKIDKTRAPYVDIEVLKVFDDLGYEKNRPESVIIELYKDGSMFEECELNAENDFSYIYKDLDNDFVWDVKEKEVTGYEVKYKSEVFEKIDGEDIHRKLVITVTNTYIVPPSSDTPPEIPNTGVLWWPVPVLFIAGIGCLLLSYSEKKLKNGKDI